MTISVITVVKDDVEGLQRTRNSVLAQSTPVHQHVIVLGASSDGTVELAESWSSEPGVLVIHESGRGIYRAMNDGLKEATGRFVVFLNAGDWFTTPEATSVAAARLEDSGRPWGYGPIQVVDAEGRPLNQLGTQPFSTFRLLTGVDGPPHQSTYVDTELLRSIGGFDESYPIVADWLATARLALLHHPCQWAEVLVAFNNVGVSSTRYRATWLQNHEARTALLQLPRPLALLSRAHVEIKVGRVELLRRGGRMKRALKGQSA